MRFRIVAIPVVAMRGDESRNGAARTNPHSRRCIFPLDDAVANSLNCGDNVQWEIFKEDEIDSFAREKGTRRDRRGLFRIGFE